MAVYMLLLLLFVAFSVQATRAKESTEKYGILQYSYVGLFEKQGSRIALLKDPDDKIHRVQVGNVVGRHHGAIVQIHDDFIQVKELFGICGKPGYWVSRFNYIARKGIELRNKKRDDRKAKYIKGHTENAEICLPG